MERPEHLKILFSEEQIRQKVSDLARRIEADCDGRRLCVVGVLDNGFMFMSDLVRKLQCPVECQLVKMESHDLVEDGHTRRHIMYSPMLDVEGKDVILVDAVLHTAVTMDHLMNQFRLRQARSVKTAVLIDKPDERRVDLKPDFWGFQMQEDKRLVGYGLGYDDLYRNLPYVGHLPDTEEKAGKGRTTEKS